MKLISELNLPGWATDRGAVIEAGNRLTQINGYTLEYDADGNVKRKSF
ncbi:MAG: hypothetical protein M3P24_11230 [Gemmatimonadota bacterium]|nr:hypothetical protein [Gemmatimonadota bacterium]